ncbi:MAG: type II secretion system F family protein [Pseudomonadota bacterium]
MRILFTHYFGYFSVLLMVILTLLLPWWLKDWGLQALKSQEWISIELFRSERRFLKRFGIWGVALSLGLSWVVSGRLMTGIILLFFFPGFFRVLVKTRYKWHSNQLARDFLLSLYSVKGLIDVGTPFPQALLLISKESSTKLNSLFDRIIRGFRNGKSLETNFKNLSGKSPEEWIFRSLKLLEKAYRKGLTLSPLIENLIQLLEVELQARERLKRLQRDLWIQAMFAGFIPWFLGWVCWTFQPEIIEVFLGTTLGKSLLILSLFWEGLGLWVLRSIIRFC